MCGLSLRALPRFCRGATAQASTVCLLCCVVCRKRTHTGSLPAHTHICGTSQPRSFGMDQAGALLSRAP